MMIFFMKYVLFVVQVKKWVKKLIFEKFFPGFMKKRPFAQPAWEIWRQNTNIIKQPMNDRKINDASNMLSLMGWIIRKSCTVTCQIIYHKWIIICKIYIRKKLIISNFRNYYPFVVIYLTRHYFQSKQREIVIFSVSEFLTLGL